MIKLNRTKLAKGFVAMLSHYDARQMVPVLAHEIVRSKLANQVDLILADINQELLRQTGRLEAEVVSAHQLTDAVRRLLRAAITEHTGASKVVLNERLEHGVVGGVMARTPETELNLTMATKLRRLAA